ncbi:hypothetical protein N5D66_00715 [Delftia tsuruhatensis]|uniref:hypothetical protein n=1 Tax=Delftia tsuruhatensis TaxID=180282 RepID=UPI0024469277|nr:hypothetical protein [Delftia tsuruhatensis]MDH0846444.1 hypothetical protein [Delftia tsuruhatensis]
MPVAVQAGVIFDNFRGQVSVPGGSPAPNYLNYSGGNSVVQLQNLVSFASSTTNIASSGTAQNIDWNIASATLCNSAAGSGWQSSAACQQWLQGRVVYALVVFPTAGTYGFSAAHDDEVKVEFSTNFTKANAAHYRTFDYNVPVGQLGSFTSGDTQFENIPGSFVVAQNNTCYAMRVHWNNQGGLNHLRLRWTPPGQSAQIIPAANLRDPSDPASYDGCANFNTDIGIAKTGPDTFDNATPFDYELKVWNYGPNAAGNVTVADLLPDNVSLTSPIACISSGAAVCGTQAANGRALSMRTGVLPVNSSGGAAHVPPTSGDYLVYRFQVTPASGTNSITNTAAITINDTNPANNSSTFVNQRQGQVVVEKSGPNSVLVGQGFAYQLTLTNYRTGGTAAISNPVVQDQLPPGVAATTSTAPVACAPLNVPGALLTCTLPGTLAGGGASQTFSIQVNAPAVGSIVNYAATHPAPPATSALPPSPPGPQCDAVTTSCTSAKTTVVGQPRLNIPVTPTVANILLTNTATATGGGDPLCPSACSSQVQVPVKAPRLAIAKSASMESFVVGLNASYVLTVRNTGTAATTAPATVTDTVAANLLINSVSAGCSFAGQLVSCTIPAGMATSSQVSFAISVTPQPAAANTAISNVAQVGGGGDPSCAAGCTSNEVLVPVNASRLRIVKRASDDAFIVGQPARYVLTVTNTGMADTIAETRITDVIATTLTIGTLPGPCTAAGQLVTCTIAAGLAPGGQVSFTIPVTPMTTAGNTTISNTARVDGGGDPSCLSGCSSNEVVEPVNTPQLQIAKTASSRVFVVGQAAYYTITVRNTGTAATTAPTLVRDVIASTLTLGTLPAGCSVMDQVLSCTVPAGLATGGQWSAVIPVTPQAAAANTTLANTASLTGGGDPSCVARCDSGTVTTPVESPRLEVSKTASAGAFAEGQAASYVITVRNVGTTATTQDAVVRDEMASGLMVTGVSAGCAFSGQTVLCTVPAGLGVGASATFTLSVVPRSGTAGSSILNTAHVTGGGDPLCLANCDSPTVVVPVNAPKLSLAKTFSSGHFLAGQSANYVFTVTNTGTTATTAHATVRDVLSTSLALGTMPAGCTASGQSVACIVPAGLAVGQSASFTIPVTAKASAGNTTLVNTANVTGGGDASCETGCTGTVTTPIGPSPSPASIPVDSPWMLALLGVLLAAGAALQERRLRG